MNSTQALSGSGLVASNRLPFSNIALSAAAIHAGDFAVAAGQFFDLHAVVGFHRINERAGVAADAEFYVVGGHDLKSLSTLTAGRTRSGSAASLRNEPRPQWAPCRVARSRRCAAGPWR